MSDNKNKRLKKGLDAIFGESMEHAKDFFTEELVSKDPSSVSEYPVSKIFPNKNQPRIEFDKEKLEELALSIKENGLLSPIVIRENGENYQIIAGERRYRAIKDILGWETIKAIVLDVTEQKMQELALIENIQRENLNPIEEAISVRLLIDSHKMTHEEVSKVLGKSRTYVTNLQRVLNLNEDIVNSIRNSEISLGHAKVLVSLNDDIATSIWKETLSKNLTVRQVEELARNSSNSDKKKSSNISESLTKQLNDKLSNLKNISIKDGKLKITFKTDKDIKNFIEKLK